jgi:signal transduction histidine kinase
LGLLAFVVCTVVALCQAAQYYFFFDPDDGPVSLPRALGLGFALWYTWGLLWLLAYRLARRFSLGAQNWPGRLAVHGVTCLVIAFLKIIVDYPIIRSLYCPRPETLTFPVFLQMGMSGPFLRFMLYYWALIGVSHAVDYYSKFRDGELRAARLEAGLAHARLHLLKTQLHPHFLFNTLNAISALVHTDVEAADHMLARLGNLLRLALEDFGLQEAPLSRELEILHSYLDIEQARLGPRLHIEWLIDPDTTEALVPTFLLQPLVENAIRHGIAPRTEPGRLEIRAWREGPTLRLQVRDDGPGLPGVACNGSGVGLSNTRARLFHLYRTEQRMEVHNDPDGGCVARITLPYREPSAEPVPAIRRGDDPSLDRG